MGALKTRTSGIHSWEAPRESYPDARAPRNPYAKDAAYRSKAIKGGTVAGVDDESDFVSCAQCNAPQRLSWRTTCYNCESDNREGIRFPST